MLKQLGNNPKMAALYYRTATKETDCLHFDNQMHKLLCYASERGICNFKLYADIGVSGLTLDRPAFNALKTDIDAGCRGNTYTVLWGRHLYVLLKNIFFSCYLGSYLFFQKLMVYFKQQIMFI